MNLKALTLALFLSEASGISVRNKLKSQLNHKTKATGNSDPGCTFAVDRIANDAAKYDALIAGAGPQEDADFPADSSSLYFDGQDVGGNQLSGDYVQTMKDKVAAWKRPTEIVTNYGYEAPTLWGAKGIQPHGINQGLLGDCWFLAGTAATAEHANWIYWMFEGNQNMNGAWPEQGVFKIHFHVRGQRKAVLIDDRLPVDARDKLVNSKPSDQDAWWFVMVEKAFAKLNLNYATLNGGFGVEALRANTGMPAEYFRVQNKDPDTVFAMILEGDQKDWTMTTGCSVEGNGLITGHLYSLLGAHQFANGEKLVHVRNPWGVEKYNGQWADNSDKWTDEMKAEIDFVAADDGAFWVSLDTFYRQFDSVTIARTDANLRVTTFTQAGKTGQQFFYNVNNPVAQDVIFGLDQGAPRMQRSDCQPDNMKYNMYLLNAAGNGVLAGPFAISRQWGWSQFEMKGLAAGDYQYLIINWGDTAAAADYNLQIYAKNGLSLSPK